MADVAENLRAFLMADATVAALIGNRLYQDHVPEGTKRPFAAYQITGSRRERCLDDAVGTSPFSWTFNVDAVGDRRTDANNVRNAINGALDAYDGTFGDTTVDGVFCEDQSDDYEPFSIPADSGLHVASQIVEVIP